MSDNKKVFKNSAILYLRLVITSVIGIFSSRFVINSLGVSDFGLYNVVGGLVFMMAFLNTVMTTTTFRYIAYEMGKGDVAGVNKVFNISLIIHIFLAFTLVFFAETIGEFYIHKYLNVPDNKIADALFVFRLSVVGVFFSIVSIPYQGLITAQENFAVQAKIEIIRSLLSLFVAIIVIYYLGNRLRLYALLTAIVMLIPPLLYYIYSRYKYFRIIRWNFEKDRKKYKEMLSFSGWIMIGAGASVGKVQGAALFINSFFGTVLNASFGIANQVNNIVLMFAQNLGQAAVPQITKSFSSGNQDRTINLVSYISKYTFFLMLLPAFPILLEIDYLLELWLGAVPIYTAIFCKLMILNALIDCLGSGIPAIIQASGKIKYFYMISSTTSLLSLPIAYVLFKLGFPPYYILIAYIVTAIINVGIFQILLKKLMDFNVKYFLKISYLRIFYVVACISPVFYVQTLFPSGLAKFLLLSVSSVIWFLLIVYHIGLEPKERDIIKVNLKRLKYLHIHNS